MGISMASAAVFLLAVGALAYVSPISQGGLYVAEATALLLLPASCVFVAYAMWVYHWRGRRLQSMRHRRVDDPHGANAMLYVVVAAFAAILVLNIVDMALIWRAGAGGGGDSGGDDPAGPGGDDPPGGGGGPPGGGGVGAGLAAGRAFFLPA